MIELSIGNSVSRLKGLPVEHHRALRKLLSYRDTSKRIERAVRDKATGKPIINASTGRVTTVMIHPTVPLMDKTGAFPTGLLYMVRHYLQTNKVLHCQLEGRIRPRTGRLSELEDWACNIPYEPYPEQAGAAKAAFKYGRGIIVAPTGVGKSIIAALIVKEIQVSTLIVVPSVELKNQLTASLTAIFGRRMVGPLVKGKKAYEITVENVDQLEPKKKVDGFDCVIVDEFHHSGAATYRELNKNCWDGIYFKFGLTATPFRSKDDERLLLEGVLSRVIYQVPYDTAVDRGYIVPMETYYVDLPKKPCAGKTWQTVYKELVVNRQDRNEAIVNFAESLQDQNIPTLILVKHIEHGLILQRMLEARGLIVPFANGKDGNNRELIAAFNAREFPVLIGTTGVIGEGVDTKPCEYVIMAAGGKSKNAFMQQLGRGFRVYEGKLTCKIIMFRDTSHKWLREHYNACCRYLIEEYGAVPARLDLVA